MSKRGEAYKKFSEKVLDHVENYTVPQYGDAGEDQVTDWTAEDCIKAVKKYAARFGANARAGQERLDFLKMSHYAQLAAEKWEEERVPWCVHVIGPDSILPVSSPVEARQREREINGSLPEDSGGILFKAVAKPWPFSREAHEKSLAEGVDWSDVC